MYQSTNCFICLVFTCQLFKNDRFNYVDIKAPLCDHSKGAVNKMAILINV